MRDNDELAGRIDGVARALMTLVALMETQGIVSGPDVSQAWRGVRRSPANPATRASLNTLAQMADELDAARRVRLLQAPQR